MAAQQVTPVTCPTCGTQFTAPLNILISGQDMAQKSAFLQGQLNIIQCPQCGFAGHSSVPVFYYDLEKELALVFVPSQLSLTGANQDKIIGDLTNKLINSLPTEQRKFYLFNPKPFLTLESMVKAILEADGITEEMIQAQEARTKLLEEFMRASDETNLRAKIKEHDGQLDREFFELLTFYIQSAQLSGDQNSAQAFLTLRTLISRWSSKGKQIVAEIDKELGLVVMQNQEELLERLQQAQTDQEFETLVAAAHSLLDYAFFQQLTNKIDQAAKNGNSQTAQTLRDVRSKILEVKAKHEEITKKALEQASAILQEILESDDPERTLDKKLNQINDAFFYVLRVNIEQAQRQKDQESAKALEALGNAVIAKLQQQQARSAKVSQPHPQIHIASR